MTINTIDIIIPSCKTLDGVSPMVCDIEGFSRGHRVHATCKMVSASENRNSGLEWAKSEIVVMLDDDISGFYTGWIDDLVAPLLADKSVIISSAHLVNLDGSNAAMMFQGKHGEDITAVPRVPTAAIAFRKNKVRFNTEFKGSGFEDDFFCLEMQQANPTGHIVIANKCRLVHANEMKNQHGKFYEHNKATFERLLEKNTELKALRNRTLLPMDAAVYRFHSEHGQDKWLHENIFKGKRDGVFVEVGVIDGLLTSNSLFFEQSLGWRGLLVEANPVFKSSIPKNRPNCKVEMSAVSDKVGTAKFLRCNGVTGWSGLEQSMEIEHALRIKDRHTEGQVETIEVPTLPLADILTKHGITGGDYLSIDIEGAEYDALKNFPFKKFPFGILDIENNYNNDRVKKLVEANGYKKIARLGVNDIYQRIAQ